MMKSLGMVLIGAAAKPSPMEWNASDVALLTALWTKGHSAGQIADRLQPQRGVRQVVAHGPEARSQAANSKNQNKAGAEAKAGVVGCLRPPGGEDGVAEDSSEAA